MYRQFVRYFAFYAHNLGTWKQNQVDAPMMFSLKERLFNPVEISHANWYTTLDQVRIGDETSECLAAPRDFVILKI